MNRGGRKDHMKVLIIGATSAIAQETAKLFAKDGSELCLVGRNPQKLVTLQEDLLIRGASKVTTLESNLCNLDGHQPLVEGAINILKGLDAVLIAHGTLGNQKRCEQSVPETLQELNTNCLSSISLLTLLANYFEMQRKGCIAVISSVAGDRGRQSNYVYGAAKGAVTIFLQGLRNRLAKFGVAVVTIKPGLVDTPMTAEIKKNPIFSDSKAVGETIYRVMKCPQDVVYIPWFWTLIMAILRGIPEPIFKRLPL